VLLSGGLDSAVNLAMAKEKGDVLLSLTFDYNQLAREKEIAASASLCRYYGVEHMVIKLPWFSELAPSALTDKERELPHYKMVESNPRSTTSAVWVPCRNAIFVTIAAAVAESRGADTIVAGFNAEEGQIFPDNSVEFIEAANKMLRFATLKKVQVCSLTASMRKKEIVEEGVRLGVPFSLIWSCYKGGEKMCGCCESCVRCINAFKEAGFIHILKERIHGV
jgi:7-cyano-7-deazaguanine synthase